MHTMAHGTWLNNPFSGTFSVSLQRPWDCIRVNSGTMLIRLVTALLLVGTCLGWRFYQEELPNGDLVPHPCKPNFFWRGLGHANPLGSGARNPFGLDFAKFHKWTYELCMMDSDGDGFRNGEELGDPNCNWVKGQIAEVTKGITHPGVCDPWGSPQCEEKNKDVSCETGEFICDSVNDPEVFNITLRFPPTPVPSTMTSYICYSFELDMLDPNTDYHLIATKPYIDNANVMHHTVITGCDIFSQPTNEPYLCNMATPNCRGSLGFWTVGLPGECIYEETGFKIGPKVGMPRLVIQHHWTNPEFRTDYVDSSGITLYLTTKMRRYNAKYLTVGQLHLVIPPLEERVEVTSTCTSRCTNSIMEGSVNLVSGINHMHYLGYRGNVEHFRNGTKLRDLTPDEDYSYDNPIIHQYNPPIEMRPGDELKTTCVFKSTTRSTTTFYGEGTYEEMCFPLFMYFPAENLNYPTCTTWDELELCDYDGIQVDYHGCRFDIIYNASHPARKQMISELLDHCNYVGECRRECPAAIKKVTQENACFGEKLRWFVTDQLKTYLKYDLEMTKFLAAMQSCECELKEEGDWKDKWPWTNSSPVYNVSLLLVVVSAVCSLLLL